jgi:hypothetical protein
MVITVVEVANLAIRFNAAHISCTSFSRLADLSVVLCESQGEKSYFESPILTSSTSCVGIFKIVARFGAASME